MCRIVRDDRELRSRLHWDNGSLAVRGFEGSTVRGFKSCRGAGFRRPSRLAGVVRVHDNRSVVRSAGSSVKC
jgi:hypothetical protein